MIVINPAFKLMLEVGFSELLEDINSCRVDSDIVSALRQVKNCYMVLADDSSLGAKESPHVPRVYLPTIRKRLNELIPITGDQAWNVSPVHPAVGEFRGRGNRGGGAAVQGRRSDGRGGDRGNARKGK